jgi:outer membrane protein OmpA-like peptidoglycan-associated protein
MKFTGLGPANPLAGNDTPDGRAKNRRVEVVIGGILETAAEGD